MNQYIHNISKVSKEAKEGAWETIGQGFSSIGQWFSNLGGGLLKTILIPIVAVIGFEILVLICVKVIRRVLAKKSKESAEEKKGSVRKGKKRKREDVGLENQQSIIYEELKI